jgi:hypothetical protein
MACLGGFASGSGELKTVAIEREVVANGFELVFSSHHSGDRRIADSAFGGKFHRTQDKSHPSPMLDHFGGFQQASRRGDVTEVAFFFSGGSAKKVPVRFLGDFVPWIHPK